jgi:hypothetical protein
MARMSTNERTIGKITELMMDILINSSRCALDRVRNLREQPLRLYLMLYRRVAFPPSFGIFVNRCT